MKIDGKEQNLIDITDEYIGVDKYVSKNSSSMERDEGITLVIGSILNVLIKKNLIDADDLSYIFGEAYHFEGQSSE